jgi:hypothetical protein
MLFCERKWWEGNTKSSRNDMLNQDLANLIGLVGLVGLVGSVEFVGLVELSCKKVSCCTEELCLTSVLAESHSALHLAPQQQRAGNIEQRAESTHLCSG